MSIKEHSFKILTTSHAIRKEIVGLMSPGCKRRVAITAFVGDGASAYIPSPQGIQIFCWPKAGGTNPNELRRIKQAGAQVWFADRLHMKVYWAHGRHAIISSANLSTNALGFGNLKEIAVVLPHSAIDIDSTISSLKPRPFNKIDMDKLEEAHRKLSVRRRPRRTKEDQIKYLEWYAQPARAEWKLGWWEEYGRLSTRAIEILQHDYGKKTAEDWLSCRKQDYKEADWVLTFKLTNRGASAPLWMYIDRIVPVSRRDKEAYSADYSRQAIQAYTARHYPAPPFTITKDFRKAFQRAVHDYGIGKIKNLRSVNPPSKLLKMIAQGLKSQF